MGGAGKNASTMKPANAAGKNFLPIEVSWLELSGGFVASVVENNRRAYSVAAIAVHRGHVRPLNAVVFKVLVNRLHPHRFDALGDEFADGVIHHCGGDTGLKTETIREVSGYVEFAPADVDLALGSFAERDDSRIEPMDKCAKGEEIERSF